MSASSARVVALAASAWVAVATLAWIAAGWQIVRLDPPSAAFAEFPARALAALAVGTLGFWLPAGAGLALLGRHGRAMPAGTALLAAALLGWAAVGAAEALIAFVHVGPGVGPVLGVAGWIAWGLRRKPVLPKFRAEGFALASVLAWIGVLLAAAAPAVESDGLRYHLVAPQEWLRAGKFVPLAYQANSHLPSLLGLAAAQHSGGWELGRVFQVMHAWHALALIAMAGELARRVFRGAGGRRIGERVRGLGMLLCAGVPAAMIVGAWPFSDVASAAYLLAALVLCTRRRSALPIGLLLGACVASKASSLPMASLVGAWALADQLRQGAWRSAALLVAAGALVSGPWFAKSWMYTGNPLYPAAYGVFGGAEWSAENDAFYKAKTAEKGLGRDAKALAMAPWNLTARWPAFEGHNPGPGLLALLPAALLAACCGWRARWLALLLAASFAAWWASYQSVRFLIPHLAVLAALGAGSLLALAQRGGAAKFAMGALAFAGACGAAWTPAYHLFTDHVWRTALGRPGADVFIARRFAAYPIVQWLNENAAGQRVLYIGEFRMAYAARFVPVGSDWFDTPRVLAFIRETPDNAAMAAKLHAEGVELALLNQAELSLYEAMYFRPRFAPAEWERFEAFRRALLANAVFDSGTGIAVCRMPLEPAAPPAANRPR